MVQKHIKLILFLEKFSRGPPFPTGDCAPDPAAAPLLAQVLPFLCQNLGNCKWCWRANFSFLEGKEISHESHCTWSWYPLRGSSDHVKGWWYQWRWWNQCKYLHEGGTYAQPESGTCIVVTLHKTLNFTTHNVIAGVVVVQCSCIWASLVTGNIHDHITLESNPELNIFELVATYAIGVLNNRYILSII